MKFDLENCKKKYQDLKKDQLLKDKLNTISSINENIERQREYTNIYDLYNIDYIKNWLIELRFTVEKINKESYTYLKISGWAD